MLRCTRQMLHACLCPGLRRFKSNRKQPPDTDLLCYQEAVLGPASSPPITQACHVF